MKNIAAFFDIDGTFYRDSLMVEHFKTMIKYEIIDPGIWHNHAKETFSNWDKRQGNYEDYLLEVANIYIKYLKGLKESHIEFMADQVINKKGDRVYRYTREKIKWHIENNHLVIFISGAPEFLLKRMAEKYGARDYIGTKYICKNGIFTGDIIQMWDSESKDKAIKCFVDKYDLDLDKSYAYGDTNGDFNMLKSVGNPVAMNPVKELIQNIEKDEELKKKLKLIIERKDVIYETNLNIKIKKM